MPDEAYGLLTSHFELDVFARAQQAGELELGDA